MPNPGLHRYALVPLVLAAACSTQTRLIVEVDATGDETVDEVRLYVANRGGTDMTLTPALRRGSNVRAPIDGKAFIVDVPADAEPRLDVPADRIVSLAFAEGDAPADHLTVLAVGFADGDPVAYGMAFDLAIVADETRIATILLRPANDDGTRYLQVWGPEEGDDTCAVAQIDGGKALFMLSHEGDVDCDGFANDAPVECDEHVHLAAADAGPGGLLPETEYGPSNATCHIPVAAAGCIDGQPNDQPADPRPYCTTTDVCDLCLNPFFCGNTPRAIQCIASYAGGTGELCETAMQLPLDVLPPSASCQGAATLYIDDPPHWVTSRTIIDDGVSVATASLATDMCSVSLSVEGSISQLTSGTQLAVALPISSANTAGVVLQVALSYEEIEDCSNASPVCLFDDGVHDVVENEIRECLAGP